MLINRNKILFAIEANFFSSSEGSKLNEIARSYKMLSSEIKKISGIKFIWITDGKGWQNSKRVLKEVFENVENVLNINDLESGEFSKLFIC